MSVEVEIIRDLDDLCGVVGAFFPAFIHLFTRTAEDFTGICKIARLDEMLGCGGNGKVCCLNCLHVFSPFLRLLCRAIRGEPISPPDKSFNSVTWLYKSNKKIKK